MEFKPKKKKIKVILDDVSYEMRMPTVKEIKNISKEVGEDDLDSTIQYFHRLGLPVEATESLDLDDFRDLSEMLFSVKKK